MMKRALILVLLINLFPLQAQDREIISRIAEKYNQIENFQAKVKIMTDVPNFRMPVKTVRIFYTAPDSIRMKARGFALLPKDGVLPFMYLNKMTADSLQPDTVYITTKGKKSMTVLSFADTSLIKNGQFIMTIDNYLERIEQVQMIVKDDTLSTMDFSYQNVAGFWMPDTTVFSFCMKKRIPSTAAPSITNPFGSVDIGSPEDHFNNHGSVTLIFSDIRVNE